MEVIKHGKQENFKVHCSRCEAILKCTLNDIVDGSGKTLPISDYLGAPLGNRGKTDVVRWVLKYHRRDYIETGTTYCHDGYVICPECGNKIDLMEDNIVAIYDKIYPEGKLFPCYDEENDYFVDENGLLVDDEEIYDKYCQEVEKDIFILKTHIEEYEKQKQKNG